MNKSVFKTSRFCLCFSVPYPDLRALFYWEFLQVNYTEEEDEEETHVFFS